MLTLTGKQRTGSFLDSLIEIPDGKWFIDFNVAREDGEVVTVESLPTDFCSDTGAEMRVRLREYLCTHHLATLGLAPVTVTTHYGVPIKKRQRIVPDLYEETYEPNLKQLFVADHPFLLFYIGRWSEETMGCSSTFATARMVNPSKNRMFANAPYPVFTRGAVKWNWTRMTDLASVIGLEPLVAWNFYYHIAIGVDWISSMDDQYGMTFCLGDTPEETCKTREVELKEGPPSPVRLRYNDPYSVHTESAKDFSCVQWDKVWVNSSWAMRVCYLHHFGFKPVV